MTSKIRTIQRTSCIGLWGSVAVFVLAAIMLIRTSYFHLPSSYHRWILIFGTVLALLSVSMVLLTVRKRIPILRQSESLEAKLTGYAAHVRSIYLSMLGVVFVESVLAMCCRDSVLFMWAVVCILELSLNYPGMYRIKIDLGLTDDEMSQLFGDKYPRADGQQN